MAYRLSVLTLVLALQIIVPRTPPALKTISPSSGAVGASVTVTGSGLGATQENSTLTVNGVAAVVTSWSDTSITFTVPSSSTGSVIVNRGGLMSNGLAFTVSTCSLVDGHDHTVSAAANCFPDASNTGVPAGTSLSASGTISTSSDGQTITGKDITGCLNIDHNNVTVTNTRVTGTGCTNISLVEVATGKTGFVMTDSEVICDSVPGGKPQNGVGTKSFTIRRVDIQGCENASQMDGGNIVAEDNYVHNLQYCDAACDLSPDPHIDGFQLFSSASSVNITHNTILSRSDLGGTATNSAVTSPPGGSNIIVTENLFAGGGWTLYCVQGGAAGGTSGFTNNRFSTQFYTDVGAFGPRNECGDEVWTGNVCYETGAAILTSSPDTVCRPPAPAPLPLSLLTLPVTLPAHGRPRL